MSGILKILIYVCVAVFAAMSVSHYFGIKLPMMFVYFDTPYYGYQDKIIAFTLLTYMSLFVAAVRHQAVVPYALASLWTTTLGLALVNLSDDLRAVVPSDGGTWVYWLQTAVFFGLSAAMTAAHAASRRRGEPI